MFFSILFLYLYLKQAICYTLCESKLGYSVSIVLQPVFGGWVVICSCCLITSEVTVTAVGHFPLCMCLSVWTGTSSLGKFWFIDEETESERTQLSSLASCRRWSYC